MSSISEHSAVTQTGIASLRAGVVSPVRFLGFWLAVLAPFVLLGLILTGFAAEQPLATTGVLAGNVAGLVVGSDYNR